MNKLHRYLLRQVIASLALTVAVFTFVLLLGSVLRELLPLLIAQKAPIGILAQAVGLLIPFVASFALPIGMLTSTLLVFGRFSADQELTAARASGISLLSLIMPIVLLSLALCGVSLFVNLETAPQCRRAYMALRNSIQATLINVQLPEGRVISSIPGFIFYVGRNRNQELQDVRVYKLANETNIEMTIYAPRGRIESAADEQKLTLHLYRAQTVYLSSGVPVPAISDMTYTFDLGATQKKPGEPKISDMSYLQLRGKLRDLESRIQPPLQLNQAAGSDGKPQARAREPRKDIIELIHLQIHRRWAFSFACFGFTLVGIPLGIRMHRRETNIGIAVALALLALYYALIIVADSLSGRPEYAPHLLMWAPNFLFQSVGAVLLWRANRGF